MSKPTATEAIRTNAERHRVIAMAEARNEFVTDVDGFVYWWPCETSRGHLASHHLRWLADELDYRNEEWNKHIEATLK